METLYVFRVPCKDDAAWELFERRGAIEGVGDEILSRGEDVFRADDLLEVGDYLWCEWHVWAGCFMREFRSRNLAVCFSDGTFSGGSRRWGRRKTRRRRKRTEGNGIFCLRGTEAQRENTANFKLEI